MREESSPFYQNLVAAIDAGNAAIAGDHPPASSLRLNDHPGLAVGRYAAAGEHKLRLEDLDRVIAEGTHPIVDRGGIIIALRRADNRRRHFFKPA